MSASVLDRIRKLVALAASPNENEARNAAVLAARLIREHRIALSLPRTPAPIEPRRRSSTSKRAVRRVADPPQRITSPLGGDCLACGARYRAGADIYWFTSGGGMHARCFEDWLKER